MPDSPDWRRGGDCRVPPGCVEGLSNLGERCGTSKLIFSFPDGDAGMVWAAGSGRSMPGPFLTGPTGGRSCRCAGVVPAPTACCADACFSLMVGALGCAVGSALGCPPVVGSWTRPGNG